MDKFKQWIKYQIGMWGILLLIVGIIEGIILIAKLFGVYYE